MGVVHKQTIPQQIAAKLNLPPNDDTVALTVFEFRQMVHQTIKDSMWDCPMHENIYSDDSECIECKDAKEVNVILANLLQAQIFNHEGLTTS